MVHVHAAACTCACTCARRCKPTQEAAAGFLLGVGSTFGFALAVLRHNPAMHSVMRKYQGLPYEPPKPQGMKANLALLVDVSVRSNPEPMPADTLAPGFGSWAHPKLVGEMTGSIEATRSCEMAIAPRVPSVCGTAKIWNALFCSTLAVGIRLAGVIEMIP